MSSSDYQIRPCSKKIIRTGISLCSWTLVLSVLINYMHLSKFYFLSFILDGLAWMGRRSMKIKQPRLRPVAPYRNQN